MGTVNVGEGYRELGPNERMQPEDIIERRDAPGRGFHSDNNHWGKPASENGEKFRAIRRKELDPSLPPLSQEAKDAMGMERPKWEQELPAGYRMATEADRGTVIQKDWEAWLGRWSPVAMGAVGKALQPHDPKVAYSHVPMCIPVAKEAGYTVAEVRDFAGAATPTEDDLLRFTGMPKTIKPDHPWWPKPFTPNKYTRNMPTLDGRTVPVDVYCVLAAFPTGSAAVDHAIKKQLAPGARGVKSRLQDLKEARASLDRAIQLEEAQSDA